MTPAPARLPTQTDADLMELVAAGDTGAFEVIYDRYSSQVYSLARSIAGRAGGAEEATQDAFLTLWRKASSFDPARASLSTWLLTIVRNRSIDLLRQATPRLLLDDITESAAERIEAAERTEDQVLAIQEYEQALRLVAELPPEQREAVALRYIGGYTQEQIAEKVGIPLGTAKGRARLGMLKLREAAERESGAAPVSSQISSAA